MGYTRHICIVDIRKLSMKNHLKYKFAALSLLLTLLSLYGCTKEEATGGEGDCTSIRISTPMLEGYTKALYADDYETIINTLRVIVAPQDFATSGEFYANVLFEGNSLDDMVIENIPVGTVQIYVFANESSVGKNYDNIADFLGDVETESGKLLIKDQTRNYFPKRGSEADQSLGLPMSWSKKDVTINEPEGSGTPQEIEVELRRCVAKLRILMNNTLSEDITVTEMKFGSFFGDCFYLFWTRNLDVPSSILYEEKVYSGLNIPVAAGGSAELLLYLYPSHARTNTQVGPYTIGFTTSKDSYDMQHFREGSNELSWIARNTQVNIIATLGANANVTINYYVDKWGKEEVTVPPFN